MQPEDIGVAQFYEIMFEHWGPQLRVLHAARQARKAKTWQPESSDLPILVEDHDGDCNAIIELEKKSLTNAEKGVVVPGSEVLEDLVWGQFDHEDEGGAEAAKEEVTEGVACETGAAHSSAEPLLLETQRKIEALQE